MLPHIGTKRKAESLQSRPTVHFQAFPLGVLDAPIRLPAYN